MRTTVLRHLACAVCALSLMGLSAGAAAQSASPASPGAGAASPPLALDRFYPAPAGDRMFGVQSAYVAGELTPHFSVLADYAHAPLVLRPTGAGVEGGAVVDNQLFLHLNASLALQSRLLLNVVFPVALFQSGASPTVAGRDFTSPGPAEIGDLRAGLRLRLFGGSQAPFQLALGGYVWFPTGRAESGSFVGEGTVRGLPQLIAGGMVADRMVWAFNVGPDLRGHGTFGGAGGVAQGTMIRLDGGLGIQLGDARNFQVGVEGRAAFLVDEPKRHQLAATTNFEAMLGARYRFLHDFEAGVGAGPGLSGGLGTPDVRAVAMLSYSPAAKKEGPSEPEHRVVDKGRGADMDGDSVADAEDACPAVPGPRSEHPSQDGCPDSDDDGIVDPLDACPSSQGAESPDAAKNGCPDGDGDGILDMFDACSAAPGVASADPARNGCPDRDGDGIVDTEDSCPAVPGIASARSGQNGCPRDSDADGIIDVEDACPGLAGLMTGDRTTHGCPGDADGDTIRDDQDACVNEKGKPDPDRNKNGCPTAVRVTAAEVVILRQVEFAIARATIKEASSPLLAEIAQALRDHPEITKIELQSHTDNTGAAGFNRALSQERAETVKAALVQRGIRESRIVPKGYGPDRPAGDNKTDEGRQKNRRLQLVILERAAAKK